MNKLCFILFTITISFSAYSDDIFDEYNEFLGMRVVQCDIFQTNPEDGLPAVNIVARAEGYDNGNWYTFLNIILFNDDGYTSPYSFNISVEGIVEDNVFIVDDTIEDAIHDGIYTSKFSAFTNLGTLYRMSMNDSRIFIQFIKNNRELSKLIDLGDDYKYGILRFVSYMQNTYNFWSINE